MSALSECGMWLLGLASCRLLLSHPRGFVPNKNSIDHAIAVRSPNRTNASTRNADRWRVRIQSPAVSAFSIVSESQLQEPARGTFLA